MYRAQCSPKLGGWTLIETLIVVVIVSVMASVVVLRWGDDARGPSPYEALQSIAQQVDVLCHQALLSQQAIGVGFDQQGLFWQRLPDLSDPMLFNEAPMGVTSTESAITRGVSWPEVTAIRLSIAGLETRTPLMIDALDRNVRPQVMCGSLGERSPFELMLQHEDQQARLMVSSVGQWRVERQ